MKRAYVATGLSLIVLVSLGYSYVIWVVTARELPPIATLRSMTGMESQRWIFVGDIHGMYDEFEQLMRKVGAVSALDMDGGGGGANAVGTQGALERSTENSAKNPPQVVLLGDFISKGPDSRKVLKYLAANRDSTHCILGNHEVNVLFALLNDRTPKGRPHYRRHRWNPITFSSEDYVPEPEDINAHHRQLAHELGWHALSEVAEHCSAALRIELEPSNETLIAVHAGILPDHLDLRSPALKEVTTMKYVRRDDHSKTSKTPIKHGIPWFKLWTNMPKTAPTVLYGHDAKSGLNLHKHTKGLDTACFAGDRLTALEYYYHKGSWQTRLHHVNCRSP